MFITIMLQHTTLITLLQLSIASSQAFCSFFSYFIAIDKASINLHVSANASFQLQHTVLTISIHKHTLILEMTTPNLFVKKNLFTVHINHKIHYTTKFILICRQYGTLQLRHRKGAVILVQTCLVVAVGKKLLRRTQDAVASYR